MRERMFKGDLVGVVGFFEEIPALMVVVAGVAIFLSSVLFAATAHMEYQDDMALRERADAFEDAFRGYTPVLEDFESGIFSREKLSGLNVSRLYADFNPRVMRFEYEIVLEEVACRDKCGAWKFGQNTPSANIDILVMESPAAVIWHDDVRPARLVIRVWEVGT